MKISGLVREISHVGFWLCGALFMGGIVEAEDHPAFQPVKELFAAMSKHDGKAMQETSTEDFQLLEQGEDWTMQKLVDAVQPNGKPYERITTISMPLLNVVAKPTGSSDSLRPVTIRCDTELPGFSGV